jgi:hypothetical protein
MLKAWLAFYEAHRRDLTTGSFAPYGDRGHPDQIIENERAAFIYYGNRYTGALALGAGAETIHIVNASAQAGIDLRLTGVKSGDYRAEVSDLVLRYRRLPQDSYLGASARLQFDVPVGCILRLTRIP